MDKLISVDERPVLDLRYAAFQHLHGAIMVVGSWYMDPDTRRSTPCLVLLDAAKLASKRKPTPCIITLDDMWKWTIELGDPNYWAGQIKDWLDTGALPGNRNNKRDVWAVMDAVQSRLRDIVSMPPLPMKAAITHGSTPQSVGELTITERDTGKTVHEIEVTSRHVRH